MHKCRGCGNPALRTIIDLGSQPPSNAYKRIQHAPERTYPLIAAYCTRCFLTQLVTDVNPAEVFNEGYAYFSQNSRSWLEHTARYCDMAVERFGLNAQDSIVLEIGGNDGHLLVNLKDRVLRAINIEPSRSVAIESKDKGVETWVEYWKPQQIQADLIIANNVMAHVPDLNGFVRALFLTLKPQGTATIEFPHALTMLSEGQFDTIYHEHYSYLSLTALTPLFKKHGLRVYDVEKLPTHGGSLRLYVGRGNQRVQKSVIDLWEEEEPLRNEVIYEAFSLLAARCRRRFLNWFFSAGRVIAYGAAAKGNTFLNYCGLTVEDIPMVADVTPAKQGMYLPGSCIPVVNEYMAFVQKPDWVLVLPWNWKDEIVARISSRYGRQNLVTAIPDLLLF